jgi:tetratricopeptide (TPR) repeat protein/DNA-binding CsgD family transcriptional regulator
MILLNGKISLPLKIYTEHLEDINGIRFTPREIDVIACILNGRSAKTIPSLLSISAKTVATHLANIRSKTSCPSRESIIDFIEKSDKLPVLKHACYISLLAMVHFEKQIKGLCKDDASGVLVHDPTNGAFIHQLKQHLELVGFKIKTQVDAEHKNYILMQGVPEPIEISVDGNYYDSFFSILKQLLPHINIHKLYEDFASYCHGLDESTNTALTPENVAHRNAVKYKMFGLGIACCSLIVCGFLWYKAGPNKDLVRSDLILPCEATLVNRSDLIAQINHELSQQKGISSVAIVGIGGAGKTTLARNYAKQFKGKLLWEINAETQGSLLQSFEGLADALSATDEDKKLLRGIQDINDSAEKQDKIIAFVRERLRLRKGWLLIYDNVESYKDVEKYFPHDPSLWGTGQVVVTTRNATIQNINAVIPIGELSHTQKLELFSQIMQQGTAIKFDPARAVKFLTEIPPFPLDVSLAAYYIKSTNISYEKYLDTLHANEEGFSGLQENILQESGSYNNTRYKIITLTIQRLVKENEEFRDLFLLVGLMDSQNIPKELLDRFKSDQIADSFIFNLNKYSLISEGTLSSPSDRTFSIHRSTQKIILDYLTPAVNNEIIGSICKAMDSLASEASDQENFTKLYCLTNHFKQILEREDLLGGENWVIVAKELGWIYFYLGNYVKAIRILEQCFSFLSKNSKYDDSLLLARVLHSLGAAYLETKEHVKGDSLLCRSLAIYTNTYGGNHELVAANLQHLAISAYYRGEYAHAKKLYDRAKDILTVNYSHKHIAIARISSRLGDANRELGNYEDARQVLEESLKLYEKCLKKDHYRIGQAQGRLGLLYKDIGEYAKARKLLGRALEINKKYYPSNCDKVIRLAGKLGQVEAELGYIEESIKRLEECHAIYTSLYPEDFRVGWIKLYLGQAYMLRGDFERAKILLEDSHGWYEKNYGKDHKETAQTIRSIGKLYYLQGDLEKGEVLLQKSLKICQASNHPQAFMDLETLGEIYLRKSEQTENIADRHNMRNASLSYFKQALEIVRSRFPNDSPHLKRIQSMVHNLEK